MRIRQMGFSSRLKAHRKILTLETLKFIVEYLKDRDARLAALRSGVPETYASRQGQWLKKHPIVLASLEVDLDDRELVARASGEREGYATLGLPGNPSLRRALRALAAREESGKGRFVFLRLQKW